MIDIYEKSGDASQRLLVRQNQPLPDFADAAEWSHVGMRETVGQDLGSVLQNQGYAVVTGNTGSPLETDWETLFGGSAGPAPGEATAGTAAGAGAPQPAARASSGQVGAAGSQGEGPRDRSGTSDALRPRLQDTVAGPVLAQARSAAERIGVPGLAALEQRVRDKPVQTLGWTLAVGFLLGILP